MLTISVKDVLTDTTCIKIAVISAIPTAPLAIFIPTVFPAFHLIILTLKMNILFTEIAFLVIQIV